MALESDGEIDGVVHGTGNGSGAGLELNKHIIDMSERASLFPEEVTALSLLAASEQPLPISQWRAMLVERAIVSDEQAAKALLAKMLARLRIVGTPVHNINPRKHGSEGIYVLEITKDDIQITAPNTEVPDGRTHTDVEQIIHDELERLGTVSAEDLKTLDGFLARLQGFTNLGVDEDKLPIQLGLPWSTIRIVHRVAFLVDQIDANVTTMPLDTALMTADEVFSAMRVNALRVELNRLIKYFTDHPNVKLSQLYWGAKRQYSARNGG